MKVYFNTQTFGHHHHELDVTANPAEAEFLVLGAKKVEIEKFINLKAVYRFGVGTDNIPFDYLKQKSIPLYFPSAETQQVLFESAANYTVFLILYMNYAHYLGDVVQWKKDNRDYIKNKTLLVIGAGNIGRRVAEQAKCFMRVKTFDIRKNKIHQLKDLISSASIISLHITATPENRDFIDREKLSWMKDDVVLINTARGSLVNEGALYERLLATDMRAAFDVFWIEPYYGRLSKLSKEKFFMTPHIAGQTKDFIEASFSEILSIIKKGE